MFNLLCLAFFAGLMGVSLGARTDWILLYAKDFEEGTLRITKPGKYKLKEDIYFNPARNYVEPNARGAYSPHPDVADKYPGADLREGAFRVGFPSAIIIEASDVELNLGQRTIQQHFEHYLQQRSWAAILIGNPYIDNVGPADFGPQPKPRNIIVRNGRLGLSSHHGILSNDASNVLIKDLQIFDFEVTGIQFNGFSEVTIEDVDIGPSFMNVANNPNYGHARFDLEVFRTFAEKHKTDTVTFHERQETKSVWEIFSDLESAMDAFFWEQVSKRSPSTPVPENFPGDYHRVLERANMEFKSFSNLPDGSTIHGILMNSKSVAVNWFGFSAGLADTVTMKNVRVHDMVIKPVEYVAYHAATRTTGGGTTSPPINCYGGCKGVAQGPHSGTINMDFQWGNYAIGETCHDYFQWRDLTYKGGFLADMIIALGIHGTEAEKFLTNVPQEFVDWVTQGTELPGSLICNGDAMFHSSKGMVGIRVDNTEDVHLQNITVTKLSNWGALGSQMCDNNVDLYATQFTVPDNRHSYHGNDVRGIALTNTNTLAERIYVSHLESGTGSVYGIDIMGDNSDFLCVDESSMTDFHAGTILNQQDLDDIAADPLPNKIPECCAVRHDEAAVHAFDAASNFIDIEGEEVCVG